MPLFQLLDVRDAIQLRLDSGEQLDFLKETAHIRADPSWVCAHPAPGLEDRRVEITGPTDRKMVVNALNSGAKTFMADFEGETRDSSSGELVLTSVQIPTLPASRTSSMDRSTCGMPSAVGLTLNKGESRTSWERRSLLSSFGWWTYHPRQRPQLTLVS